MTPGARVAAAIEVLDRILQGDPAEKALTNWGRDNRFAGSGDRHAIRDHVFDALRHRRSYAAAGGSETGRGIMIGACRAHDLDIARLFSGEGHAPSPVTEADIAAPPPDLSEATALDVPDWLLPLFRSTLGPRTEEVLLALRERAPVHLRVNLARADFASAIKALAQDDIIAEAHPWIRTALRVTLNERRIQTSAAYRNGLVELQDAASQAAVLRLPLAGATRILDYCAGGGGKSLAIAALSTAKLFAHDADSKRMTDLPERSRRAGVRITPLGTGELQAQAPFDLVLVDAPCSGSGTWRRTPDAKWRLTPAELNRLIVLQGEILDKAAALVAPRGHLAYATCSLLSDENQSQLASFLARTNGWQCIDEMQLLPGPDHDGFYLAVMRRN
jgi:16S rRNA (cytosine967-C5)-methyltransferase